MRRLVIYGLTAMLLATAAPASAGWNFVSAGQQCAFAGTSLSICVDFQLNNVDSNTWTLVATLTAGSATSGNLKALGLYANPDLTPDPTLDSVTGPGPTTYYDNDGIADDSWLPGNQGLSGPFTPAFFEVGATDAPGAAAPTFVAITFTSDALATYNGNLYARAHVGSIPDGDDPLDPKDELQCSLKFGSADGVLDQSNCYHETVPEPVSLVLLGSGLLGLGGLRMRRRNRK